MMREGFLPVGQHNGAASGSMQDAARYFGVKTDNHTNSGPLSSSGSDAPRALPPKTTHGQLGRGSSVSSPLPPALSQIINTFLGERAVMRETVKKAAPAFRRYDGSF
jgi:hypothetical protein